MYNNFQRNNEELYLTDVWNTLQVSPMIGSQHKDFFSYTNKWTYQE